MAMKQMTPDELKSNFVALEKLHFSQYEDGLIKKANKTFDRVYKLAVQIRTLPDKGAELLSELVDFSHDNVRMNAAYLLLPIDNKRALKTLSELRNSDVAWISMSAETCIQEWQAGRLDVDWFMKKYDRPMPNK
jgi:hypothetical protein